VSEQALDVHAVLSILGRMRWTIATTGLLGAVLGVLFVLSHPPLYVSHTSVMLPPDPASAPDGRDMPTEIRIVTSDAVLDIARTKVRPVLSRDQISGQVTATSSVPNVLDIEARGVTAAAAQSLARAVAQAEIEYEQEATSSLSSAERARLDERQSQLEDQLATVNQQIRHTKLLMASQAAGSPEAQATQTALARLTAQQSALVLDLDGIGAQRSSASVGDGASVIGFAGPATRPRPVVRMVVYALLFAVLFVGLAASVVVALARRDRRLRTRDEMADALGSPVIGSVRSHRVRTTAAWSELLESYLPSPVDAWSLRQVLDRIGAGSLLAVAGGLDRVRTSQLVVVVVVPADDPGALAVAGQLASHTASLGVSTHLTARQRHAAADALWATSSGAGGARPGLTVDPPRAVDGDTSSADLVLELTVVDREQPVLPDLRHADAIVLIVSSGTATEDDLARIAVVAYESGGRFRGIVVADPDSLDRTTGRLLQAQRAVEPPMPRKLTGVETDEWHERDEGQS
jgi:capsular polysaccharide biosynthesis protein